MNAVSPLVIPSASSATDALRAHRQRVAAIEREIESLRGQHQAHLTNITAAEETLASDQAVIERMREQAVPDYVALAAQQAKVEASSLRLAALRRRAEQLVADVGAAQTKAAAERRQYPALLQARARQECEAYAAQERQALAALAAARRRRDACYQMHDGIVGERVREVGPHRLTYIAQGLRALRDSEEREATRKAQGISLDALAAEIRREIERE